jgi:Na+-transporting methylmalonyl-CoA/oxaloacetate decarboxylase gamma subunit
MSFLDSLLVDVFGLSVVFAVLIALSLIIKLITRLVKGVAKKDTMIPVAPAPVAPAKSVAQMAPAGNAAHFADGELKLFDVDEKTAALIMAIVSDESSIPLSQLHFKSIRLIKQEAK